MVFTGFPGVIVAIDVELHLIITEIEKMASPPFDMRCGTAIGDDRKVIGTEIGNGLAVGMPV